MVLDNINKLVEGKIIDIINSEMFGRLIVVRPDKNDVGVDLVVEKRGDYKEKPIYLKIVPFAFPSSNPKFNWSIDVNDFKSLENFYLVFVGFDIIKQEFNHHIWFIPSADFNDIAQKDNTDGKLTFEVSSDVNIENKYSEFLIKTEEIGNILLNSFK